MIRVDKQDEPAYFDEKVRRPGREWLSNPNNLAKHRPSDFWRECSADLEKMFHSRCGYLASVLTSGNVDHFVSWKRCKDRNEHHLTYEWTNLRWIHPQLNSLKRENDLLDPFIVEDEWFDVDLFSYRLIVHTDKIPVVLQEIVERTIQLLQLDTGTRAENLRAEAVDCYREGMSLDGVKRRSPMIARALEKLIHSPDLGPEHQRLRDELMQAREQAHHR